MNILARAIGVTFYFTILTVICLFLRKSDKKNVKKTLFLYTIILSLMGFFFLPNKYNDLYRIYEIMNNYSKIPIKDFFVNYVSKSNVPVSLIYYWIIGQFKINGLLPFITTFIFYSNIFYILYDFYEKNNISNKALSLSLLIIMCNSSFFETISGIRNMLAFSILLKCFYDEFYNNKYLSKNIIWYVISALIHPSTIVLIILRFSFLVLEEMTSNKAKVLLVYVTAILSILIFAYGSPFIENVISMGKNYVLNGDYSYIWETFISVLLLIALYFIKIRCKKFSFLDGNVRLGLLNNKKMSKLLEVIVLLFIFEHSIFFRFSNFNLFLNIPIILIYNDELFKSDNDNYRYIKFYFYSILFLSCIRGNLCSLKFWE